MSLGARRDRADGVTDRLQSIAARAIAATVVLVIFAGLAVLVYIGRVEAGPLLLYAGVIVGYVLHATKSAI